MANKKFSNLFGEPVRKPEWDPLTQFHMDIASSIQAVTEEVVLRLTRNIAKEYNGNARKYGGIGVPNILFLDREKSIIHRIVGFHNAGQLIAVMDSVLLKL